MHCTSLETTPHTEGWEGEEKSNVRGAGMLLEKLKLRLLWAMLYSISKRYHSKPDNQIKAIVILIAIKMPFSAFLILKWRGQVWSK